MFGIKVVYSTLHQVISQVNRNVCHVKLTVTALSEPPADGVRDPREGGELQMYEGQLDFFSSNYKKQSHIGFSIARWRQIFNSGDILHFFGSGRSVIWMNKCNRHHDVT